MPATECELKIGVLALQGAISLHLPHIEALGARYIEVTSNLKLKEVDGLILPGGESGAILKLIEIVGMDMDLRTSFESKPSWGICAGAILMARSVQSPTQRSFNAIDIEIERNAYGRQLNSSVELIDGYQVSYIRAPRILRVGKNVNVFNKRGNDPTWVESDHSMVTTFHPETNNSTPSPWHRRFVELCKKTRIIS